MTPVGVAEIAERLGQRRQTVAQWKLRGKLPEPRWVVSGQPAWSWEDDIAPLFAVMAT